MCEGQKSGVENRNLTVDCAPVQDDDGRSLNLFGAAPRVPPAPDSFSGAAYARLAIFFAIVFAVGSISAFLPQHLAMSVDRWLLVVANAGIILGLYRFFRIAWQFRSDDKVPLVLAGLLGCFVTWRLAHILDGRDPDLYLGSGFRFHSAGTPYRWLGYPAWESVALTVSALGLALAAIWLATFLGIYWKERHKPAAMIVAAAFAALGGCVWLIVN